MVKVPGSHGSLTKAGKVKLQTPTVESKGVNSKKKSIPRKRYRRLYKERIIEDRYAGQSDSIGAKRTSNIH